MTARDAARASDRLTMALLNLAARGERTPCSDWAIKDLFTSESDQQRKLAAHACRGCPVLTECLEVALANDERFGVWGAVDFTRRPGRKRVA